MGIHTQEELDRINAASRAHDRLNADELTYQQRVNEWMLACFGKIVAGDREERNWRFFEEAGELVQSLGATREEAHRLVDYVFDRPEGEPRQEVGGVMVTLAALCLANDLDMHEEGERELRRVWGCIEKIRAKHAAKPVGIRTPLPGPSAPAPPKEAS